MAPFDVSVKKADVHAERLYVILQVDRAGIRMAKSNAIMAMTTKSSIKIKACRLGFIARFSYLRFPICRPP